MKNVRIWFEKKGAARYISHLDLTRNMARGLKLSGLPVWYTEGFNPRIYMTYAMPLSLGVCGERECMDIRLTEDVPLEDIAPRLNAHLPAGLQALEATEPVDKFEDIQYGAYQLFLEGDPAALEEQLHTLFQREEVLVLKHTKKGDKEFDIKPDFQNAQLHPQDVRAGIDAEHFIHKHILQIFRRLFCLCTDNHTGWKSSSYLFCMAWP